MPLRSFVKPPPIHSDSSSFVREKEKEDNTNTNNKDRSNSKRSTLEGKGGGFLFVQSLFENTPSVSHVTLASAASSPCFSPRPPPRPSCTRATETQTGTDLPAGPRESRDTGAQSVSRRDGIERDCRRRGVSLDATHLSQPLGEGERQGEARSGGAKRPGRGSVQYKRNDETKPEVII